MATKETWAKGTGVVVTDEWSYPRSYTCVDVEKRLVEVFHVSRTKDDLDVYGKLTFDYSKMSMEALLETASRSSMIASRLTEFRSRTAKEAIAADGMVLDAQDYFKREHRAAAETPEKLVTKLRKKFGLSKEEIVAMLADEDEN